MKRFKKIKLFTFIWVLVALISSTLSAAMAAEPSALTSLVVKLAEGLAPAGQAAVIARDGGLETSSIPALRLHVVSVPANDLSLVLQQYQSDPQV